MFKSQIIIDHYPAVQSKSKPYTRRVLNTQGLCLTF